MRNYSNDQESEKLLGDETIWGNKTFGEWDQFGQKNFW